MKRDWLTVGTIDHLITGYLCLLIGFGIGMWIGDLLDGDGFLTLAGGASGTLTAVAGAIYFERRKQWTRRREESNEVIEYVEFVLKCLPVNPNVGALTGNLGVAFAAEYEAAGRSVSHLVEEALASTEQLSFRERMAMRGMAESAVEACAKAKLVIAGMGGNDMDIVSLIQAGNYFRSSMNRMMQILSR